MHLIRISFLLTLLAVALCAAKDGDAIIGTDSDLVDNVTVEDKVSDENVTVEKENVTTEKDVTQEQSDATPSRRFFDLLPKKVCSCFPGNPHRKRISQHINIPGSSYERLVVYFYKNIASNEIKVYVPNQARQIVFPDITYEISDGLNILNPSSIDVIAHGLGPIIKSWISVIRKKPIHKPDINLEIISNLDSNKLQSLILYLKRYKETRTIFGKLTGRTLHEKLRQLKLLFPKIYANFLAKVTKFFPVWLNHGKVKRFKPNQLIDFPYDIHLIPIFQRKKVIINGRPHYNVNEIIVYKPPHIDINNYYHDIINDNVQLNIDLWLNVIIKHLNNQLQFAAKTIDIKALKSVIISILQKNGISITHSGHLVDASGKSVSYTNIILRPILIGESRVVSRIISNGLFRIPSSIVFVEVVLLGGVRAQSLGIIPIGNIFIGMNNVEISTVVEVIETTVTCEGGHCRTIKKCKDLSGNEIVCQKAQAARAGNNVVIQSRNAEPTDVRSGHNVVIQSRDDESADPRIGCPNCHRCGNHLCSYPVYEDISDGYNKVYLSDNNIIDVSRSGGIPPISLNDDDSYRRSGDIRYVAENEIDEAPRTRIIPGIANSKQSSPVYVVSEDVPGIRIIGGGAATSSGTPVSSKG